MNRTRRLRKTEGIRRLVRENSRDAPKKTFDGEPKTVKKFKKKGDRDRKPQKQDFRKGR